MIKLTNCRNLPVPTWYQHFSISLSEHYYQPGKLLRSIFTRPGSKASSNSHGSEL